MATSLDLTQILRERAEVLRQPPFLKAVGETLVSSIQGHFSTHGAWSGNEATPFEGGSQRWRPVSTSYARQKAKSKKSPTNILLWTGRLRNSIGWQLNGDGITIGTNVSYAAIHQFGGNINIPAYSRDVKFKVVNGRLQFAKNTATGKGVFTKNVKYPAHTVRIPARPIVVVGPNDRADIAALAIKYLTQ